MIRTVTFPDNTTAEAMFHSVTKGKNYVIVMQDEAGRWFDCAWKDSLSAAREHVALLEKMVGPAKREIILAD